jgi:hypothetical protein
MPENEEVAPTTQAQQEAAQASDAKAEASSTAKASDELSEDDLEALAGGAGPLGLYVQDFTSDFTGVGYSTRGGSSNMGGGGFSFTSSIKPPTIPIKIPKLP